MLGEQGVCETDPHTITDRGTRAVKLVTDRQGVGAYSRPTPPAGIDVELDLLLVP